MIGNTLSLGGGKSLGIQEVYLPSSSLYNTPTSWTSKTSFTLPVGITPANSISIVLGDEIFVIDTGKVYVGDLNSETWTHTIDTGIGYPASACIYDDYKIFIIERTTNGVVRLISFNTTDYSVVPLTSLSVSWTNTSSSGYGFYQYLPTNNLPSIFCKNNRCIYFYWASGRAFKTYDSSHNNPYLSSVYCASTLYEYDCDLNIVTAKYDKSYATNGGWTSSNAATNHLNSYNTEMQNRAQRFFNSIISLSEDESLLYLSNGATSTTTTLILNLSSDAVDETTTTSVLSYCPTSWGYFEDKKIVFNGTVPTLYNQPDNSLSSMVIPDAPVAPGFKSVNTWNNQIIFLNDTTYYSLPYIVSTGIEDPTIAWCLLKGQEICGEKELEILDSENNNETKLLITKTWEKVLKDTDIYLGEYNSPTKYRLLIRQK